MEICVAFALFVADLLSNMGSRAMWNTVQRAGREISMASVRSGLERVEDLNREEVLPRLRLLELNVKGHLLFLLLLLKRGKLSLSQWRFQQKVRQHRYQRNPKLLLLLPLVWSSQLQLRIPRATKGQR
jgi:hypothetical protein